LVFPSSFLLFTLSGSASRLHIRSGCGQGLNLGTCSPLHLMRLRRDLAFVLCSSLHPFRSVVRFTLPAVRFTPSVSPLFRTHDAACTRGLPRPHSASTCAAVASPLSLRSKWFARPPFLGFRDAPLLRFLASSAAFGLLRPQAYCSLMSDVRFTSLPCVCSPTDVVRPKSNQTLAGSHRPFPAVRYTLRRLAPRRQQNRLTTLLALLPFTTNGAAFIPSAENNASVNVPASIPKGTASDMNGLCPLLCHRHRRLDARSVARVLHPHDASEHPLAKATQGISFLMKPRHPSMAAVSVARRLWRAWLSSMPLAFQQSARVSPCSIVE